MKMYKLGFIGAGNMAEAICRAVIDSGLYSPDMICFYDPSEQRVKLFENELGVNYCKDNEQVVGESFIVILAVKPQQYAQVLDQIRDRLRNDNLIISIAAGISTLYIERGLIRHVPVIRAMPNTPLLVGYGITALCKGRYASEEHVRLAEQIFSSAGEVIRVDEELMDAITAMSGSGPAYFFYLLEAMIQAGVELGLSKDLSYKLSLHTGLGAMKLAIATKLSPEELRFKVTSPGGTTEAAIEVLESEDFKSSFISAVRAAYKRSKQLAR